MNNVAVQIQAVILITWAKRRGGKTSKLKVRIENGALNQNLHVWLHDYEKTIEKYYLFACVIKILLGTFF